LPYPHRRVTLPATAGGLPAVTRPGTRAGPPDGGERCPFRIGGTYQDEDVLPQMARIVATR
jgi:hypothetical protein